MRLLPLLSALAVLTLSNSVLAAPAPAAPITTSKAAATTTATAKISVPTSWATCTGFDWTPWKSGWSWSGYGLQYVQDWYQENFGFNPPPNMNWQQVSALVSKYGQKTAPAGSKATSSYRKGCSNPWTAGGNGATTRAPATTSTKGATMTPSTSTARVTATVSGSTPSTSKATAAVPTTTPQAPATTVATTKTAANTTQNAAPTTMTATPGGSTATASANTTAVSVPTNPSVTEQPANQTSQVTTTAATTTVAPTPALTTVNGYTSQGCVQEIDGRLLPDVQVKSDPMSIEICTKICRDRGFPVSGLEYGRECYCGTLARIASTSVSGECKMPCSGDSSEICGGPNALNIYVDPTVVPAVVVLPTGWKTYGVVDEGDYGRALSFQVTSANSAPWTPDTNTIESCANACYAAGFKVSGTEYSAECYCGNAFENGGGDPLDDSAANMVCPGNYAQKCGGPSVLSVVSILDDIPFS